MRRRFSEDCKFRSNLGRSGYGAGVVPSGIQHGPPVEGRTDTGCLLYRLCSSETDRQLDPELDIRRARSGCLLTPSMSIDQAPVRYPVWKSASAWSRVRLRARSEGRLPADSVEKHPFATAANSDLKSAQAPFLFRLFVFAAVQEGSWLVCGGFGRWQRGWSEPGPWPQWGRESPKRTSFAPHGPRNRSRFRPRILLRWAKSISTFFRSFIEITYCSVSAISRATWRAS